MSYLINRLNRRAFLRLSVMAGSGWLTIGWLGQAAAEAAELSDSSLTPDAALQKLLAGNQRFVQHHPEYPDQTESRLLEVAQAQHPFVTILSCADSRALLKSSSIKASATFLMSASLATLSLPLRWAALSMRSFC